MIKQLQPKQNTFFGFQLTDRMSKDDIHQAFFDLRKQIIETYKVLPRKIDEEFYNYEIVDFDGLETYPNENPCVTLTISNRTIYKIQKSIIYHN